MEDRPTPAKFHPILPLLVGAAAFFLIFGAPILSPTYTDWLMKGDSATHWLGWQFFRQAPLLQWPLGANGGYGMEIGSSIVFTDSIPLLALFFKPFSRLLPDSFQYIGIWLLLCLCLQSFFAWKVLSLLSSDRWLVLTGSLFFTIAPVFLIRAVDHSALVGQWTLVAGLYLYFSKDYSARRWTMLLAVTALIQAYLLAMLAAVWFADLAQRLIARAATPTGTARAMIVSTATTLAVMWAAGYFMLGGNVESDGFGEYRMNLAAPLDPDNWSRLLPDLTGRLGDYEGFAYLGSGMLGLALVACYWLPSSLRSVPRATALPILLVSAGLFVFAISNRVVIGQSELFTYELPASARPIANALRSSGRFFWPVYYLLYLAIFHQIFTRLPRRLSQSLCAGMLAFQIHDSGKAWQVLQRKSTTPPWKSALRSPLWNVIGEQYRKLIYVPPHSSPYAWLPLAFLAERHGMSTNFGYFARTNPGIEAAERARLTDLARRHQLPTDAVYVFEDDALWQMAATPHPDTDFKIMIDSLRILAPGMDLWQPYGYEFAMDAVSFAEQGAGERYKLSGWSFAEAWGTWTDGTRAELLLRVVDPPDQDLEMRVRGMALVTKEHPRQEIAVLVNGHPLGRLEFDLESAQGERSVRIPKALTQAAGGRLRIGFAIQDPVSPVALGRSSDARRLGLGLQSIAFKPRPQ